MDIFRFHNPTAATRMESGEIINGIKDKMWIERYDAAGEFKFVANADVGIREKLPIGSFISHIESTEIMIVENHEISDDKEKETEIIITGRGLETFFENRIVGSNKVFPTTAAGIEYVLAPDESWNHAVDLIKEHAVTGFVADSDDAVPYMTVMTDIVTVGVNVERTLKRGSLYERLQEVLKVDNLGIKVIRPGSWSPLGSASPNFVVLIHQGVDRTAEIMFSYDTGEIEAADYLWSNKKYKNAALVTGKWVETRVDTVAAGYDRRVMYVEANDIDNAFSTAPTGVDLTNVVAAMQQRGLDALSAQVDIALTKAEVSKNTNQSAYRTDFDVGDIITIHGDYNEISSMRISEYVEIEDENGKSGYPTLSMI